jgi:hypothetical protein
MRATQQLVKLPWLNLVARISHVQRVEGADYFKWSLTKSGLYTVRSLYRHLIDTHPPFGHGRIWKMKIPLKIKIFLWFLQREVVLTKDNWLGKMEKVYLTLNLRGLEHITPPPMKKDFLPPEFSKRGQITPEAVLKNHNKSQKNHKIENPIVLDSK